MDNFANRLRSLRKEMHLTQEEIAKKLNLSRSTYSGWEAEGKEPGIKMICVLADLFGVSCDYLLGHTDERSNTDTVFCNDHAEFKNHYENLPSELRSTVAKTFDSFYLLLNRDMQLCRSERLELYMNLLFEVQRLRSLIRNRIESSGDKMADPIVLSELMALQSELKNTVSSILDELMQTDMEIAFNLKKDDHHESSGKLAI